MQAVTTPVFRSVVVGGLLLGLAVVAPSFASQQEEGLVTRRLALHTVSEPHAIYMSAWRNGDVRVQLENGELRPITFRVRATLPDGCRWEGIETLLPLDDRSFAYKYDERILSCPEDVESTYRKTPRAGLVTVE